MLSRNDLGFPCGHVFSFSSIEDSDVLCTKTYSSPGRVNCRVPAAHDRNLAADIHIFAEIDRSEELHCTPDPLEIFTFDPECPALVRTAGNNNDVVISPYLVERNILSNPGVGLYLNAKRLDIGHFLCNDISWKPVFRDSIAHHAACVGKLLEYRDCVAAFSQILRCRKTARACTYNRDLFLACDRHFLDLGFLPVVCDIAFEPVDGHGFIELSPAAPGCTKLRTDPSARS